MEGALRHGERQVAPTIEGIRRDHVARYEWVVKELGNQPLTVLDVACGVGYGSRMLGEAGHKVVAFDCEPDAISYARAHYAHPNVQHRVLRAENAASVEGTFDAAVMFEAIEHIADPLPVLKALRSKAKMLFASVPNENVFPWKGHLYHFRHYTPQQFMELLAQAGWKVRMWHNQAGPESEVTLGGRGRTTIAVCDPDDVDAAQPGEEEAPAAHLREPLGTVAILGLGPSLEQYSELTKRLGSRHKLADETWAINAAGSVYQCDLVFHMDDVRIQEIRAAARPESNIAAMLEWLKTSDVPVITSREHPDYPALRAFPLEAVVNALGRNVYFNSTAAYAIAYAIWRGAKKILCFGMDFTYPNSHDAEKGRGCVEFWIGYAMARGIKVAMPKTSSLMDACYPFQDRVYGYDTLEVRANETGGHMSFAFIERDELPSADEIEHRYDHSRHPNTIVEQQLASESD